MGTELAALCGRFCEELVGLHCGGRCGDFVGDLVRDLLGFRARV